MGWDGMVIIGHRCSKRSLSVLINCVPALQYVSKKSKANSSKIKMVKSKSKTCLTGHSAGYFPFTMNKCNHKTGIHKVKKMIYKT